MLNPENGVMILFVEPPGSKLGTGASTLSPLRYPCYSGIEGNVFGTLHALTSIAFVPECLKLASIGLVRHRQRRMRRVKSTTRCSQQLWIWRISLQSY